MDSTRHTSSKGGCKRDLHLAVFVDRRGVCKVCGMQLELLGVHRGVRQTACNL